MHARHIKSDVIMHMADDYLGHIQFVAGSCTCSLGMQVNFPKDVLDGEKVIELMVARHCSGTGRRLACGDHLSTGTG